MRCERSNVGSAWPKHNLKHDGYAVNVDSETCPGKLFLDCPGTTLGWTERLLYFFKIETLRVRKLWY